MRRLLVFITALFLISSCTNTLPEYDWCWTYDFRVNDDFNIATGYRTNGVGLTTDGGFLSASYEESFFVEITSVVATIVRPEGVTDSIYLAVVGEVFGLTIPSLGSSVEFPSNIQQYDVTFNQQTAGISGKTINASVSAIDSSSNPSSIVVEKLVIYGNGNTPFEYNPCGPATATPQVTGTNTVFPPTWTPSPTPTDTPTPTPTHTHTFTPSPTTVTPHPPGTHIITFDEPIDTDYRYLTYSNDPTTVYNYGIVTGTGNSAPSYRATYIDVNNGYARGINQRIDIYFNQPIILGNFSFQYLYSQPLNNVLSRNISASNGGTIQCSSSTSSNNAPKNVFTTFSLDCNESLVNQITVKISIVLDGASPTNTYGYIDNITYEVISDDPPTSTPTATLTPLGFETNTPDAGDLTRTPISYNSPTPSPTINLTEFTATVPTLDATPTYITPTLIPSPTSIMTSVAQSATALAMTSTLMGNTPDPNIFEENKAEYEILDQINQNQNWLENEWGKFVQGFTGSIDWFMEAFYNLYYMILSFFNFLIGLLSAIVQFIVEMIEILFLLINLFLGLLGLFLLYIQDILARLTSLVFSFFTAPPQPIPGLPMCVTDPLSYDICAIYYIGDWTLFAQETPGQYIIPLVLALMNVMLIFRAVKYVLKFLRRGEDVVG